MKIDPNEPYEDFKIFTPSTADLASGRKYNLFKFESRKPVSPTVWPRPVRLNRKDPSGREEDEDFGKLTPMLGLDGKPVIGADGNMVMLGPDGRPALQHARPKQTDQPQPSKKKPFQRKTRQVYTIPEDLRQLRKEERFPWVMEDGTGNEVWNARLDELSKSDNHGFLVPREMEAGAFVFFPSHRFYKLARKSKRRHMAAEEVEVEVCPTPVPKLYTLNRFTAYR
jgi:transcription initiation factor TFIIF subunit alpha